MSGFPSPLWILGLGSPNPSISPNAGSPIGGIAGTLAGLSVLGGTSFQLTAKPAVLGGSGSGSALPATAGATYHG